MHVSRRRLMGIAAGGSLAAIALRFPGARVVRAQGTGYDLVDLGLFEGLIDGFGGQVHGISPTGVAFGEIAVSEERSSPATWSTSGELARLKSGKHGGAVAGMNSDGVAVGWTYVGVLGDRDPNQPSIIRPAIWAEGERITPEVPSGLDVASGDELQHGAVYDINDDGVAVGYVFIGAERIFGQAHPVRWDVTGAATLLDGVDDSKQVQARFINEAGTIAGTVGTALELEGGGVTFVDVPALWKDGGAPERIDWEAMVDGKITSDNRPVFSFHALGANDELAIRTNDGLILVRDGEATPVAGIGTVLSVIYDINAAGTMVGTALADGGQTAVLWTDLEPADLNGLIPSDADLALVSATGISDDGVIAGMATDGDGGSHGYILLPA